MQNLEKPRENIINVNHYDKHLTYFLPDLITASLFLEAEGQVIVFSLRPDY